MNRFLINLCSLDRSEPLNSASQETSRFSTLHFEVPDSVLGNIGQPLDYGIPDVEAHDETTTREERGKDIALNAAHQAEQPIDDPSYVECTNNTGMEAVCFFSPFTSREIHSWN